MQPTAPTNRPSRFPLLFELLVWGLYVGLYKYNFFMEEATRLYPTAPDNFPYPQLMMFTLLAFLPVT